MRRRTLTEEIAHYTRRGFEVTSQTETRVTLVRRKRFNPLLFFLLLGAFYLPVYFSQHDETMLLSIDDDGDVRRAGGRWTLGSWIARKMSGRA